MPKEKMLDCVLRRLDAVRGKWPQISEQSGVPYQTLTKIACRIVTDPRISTVQTLYDYFACLPDRPEISHDRNPNH
ncbi:hypothetical protein QYH69_29475 [Paraburkholderia sp. SARCC-3016]|uniref:hypothetical protein n=1 Tax=Paraburkholderia sp. SARCC-3016 TaxID=3058611 RepID=UPI002808C20A|nr:hypothetical protein [Paraburkholderia sp. SARCC-3016]MDQ7981367.1 hypothetical protein [Paraburkholderia sp. SARCC-3016]